MAQNSKMIGHDWAVEHIQGQIVADRLRHAYLISGPTGIGKQSLARSIAQAANCFDPPQPGQFCGECRFCIQANRAGHPDLFTLVREEGSKDIKVGAIRTLQRDLSLAPYDAQYRVAILVDFQHASISASNALLKTLEEPARKVILILTVDTPENLLPTIISRCEHIRLRAMPIDALADELSARDIPPEKSQLVAHISAGRPEYALKLANDDALLESRSDWLDQFIQLLSGNRRSRFQYAESIAKDKSNFRLVLQTWSSFWRDVFLKQSHSNAPLQNPDRQSQITSLAENLPPQAVNQFLSDLQETGTLMDTNVNARMAVEVLMLKMPYFTA